MKEKFTEMTHDAKWILPSGVVEDKMFDFASSLDYEHFILDIQDKCWDGVFSREDIEYIKTVNQVELPEIDDSDVVGFVQSLNGQSTGEHGTKGEGGTLHPERKGIFQGRSVRRARVQVEKPKDNERYACGAKSIFPR